MKNMFRKLWVLLKHWLIATDDESAMYSRIDDELKRKGL